ncbi:MAG TPA: hypothetical protein VJ955_06795 [Desulfuromonadales bacterium]|nr:hypothetical protein [Desulfuromonadales bacterium]
MTSESLPDLPLDPQTYVFYTPEPGRTVEVGAEGRQVALAPIPYPIMREDMESGEEPIPSDDLIGKGIYDYLRQFPDCPLNVRYAELMRDAYPHFLADLGAQIAMLDYKEVDAPYVRRKVTFMKILALLEPQNPRLLAGLGKACFELGLMFSELPHCRQHLLTSMGYLQRTLKLAPDDIASHNILGQIDYYFGDFPAAIRHWRQVSASLDDPALTEAFAARIAAMETEVAPDHPLIDDLEAIGAALVAYGEGEITEAMEILERLEEQTSIAEELASPQFFYLLGMCRARNGNPGGAFSAFDQALSLDPEYQPALEGKDLILEGKEF